MIAIIAFLIFLHLDLPPEVVNKIVDAIEVIENSKTFPFGIKSIKLKGKTYKEKHSHARKICFESVVCNWLRWNNSGKPGDFFVFMNKRYCPPDKNWSNNLKAVLKRRGFDFSHVW